ncbi:hypothetical protein GCM10020221_12720 [Streptomyces thioluteus]|uniref:Uncharacterized protein n=1 Tax=Streptomyces thioluteus TaxID=66431 RepID=A0ABN3WL81_STRTU
MTSPRSAYGSGYYAASSFPDTPIYDSLVAERGTPQIAPIRVSAPFDGGSNLPALPALPSGQGMAPPAAPQMPQHPQGGYVPQPPAVRPAGRRAARRAPAGAVPVHPAAGVRAARLPRGAAAVPAAASGGGGAQPGGLRRDAPGRAASRRAVRGSVPAPLPGPGGVLSRRAEHPVRRGDLPGPD